MGENFFCETGALGSMAPYQFVVVLSHMNGKILLSRQKTRSTWETQGGHIEPGETPEAAAHRELFEESGAVEFSLAPLCDYRAGTAGNCAAGVVFTAEIHRLGDMPESEMAETRLFDALPEDLSYPAITPQLFRYEAR